MPRAKSALLMTMMVFGLGLYCSAEDKVQVLQGRRIPLHEGPVEPRRGQEIVGQRNITSPEIGSPAAGSLVPRLTPDDPAPRGKHSAAANRILNINFGRNPGNMIFDGVVGGPYDYWTLVDVGERRKDALKLADGTETDVTMELSENDGEWGIAGHAGVYHAYLYHNCRCVDLSVRFQHLAAGLYEVYVFAHGDAPDQNAKIVIKSAGTKYSGRNTVNDGTMRYKSHDLQEGVQYVKYTVAVEAGKPVTITSKRDGSTLSMLNAIQFKRVEFEKSPE
ncbi:MAG: hypothetical protein HUJ26_09245 [Planctomycetaceae bacterium]|nr:hypothetical protein [Planctomycetaceae bacterium]